MEEKIGSYKLYKKKPNAISYGYLYTKKFRLEFSKYSDRIVRIYVPENYDPSVKYPAMVFCDGQNMVDKYTTNYGEWNIDELEEQYVKEGHQGFIMIGIDCPPTHKGRDNEYIFGTVKKNFRYINQRPEGEKLFNWIIETLLPDVKKYFSISENIAFGGSSLGGEYSTLAGFSRPDIFKFVLAFSPCYLVYDYYDLKKWIKSKKADELPRIILYCGNSGRVERFCRRSMGYMENWLKSIGFIEGKNLKIIHSKLGHHESFWNKYFLEGIRFWLD